MELYIEYAIVFALGWYIGGKVAAYLQLQVFKAILSELNISNKDLIRVARKNAPDFIQDKLDEIESQADAADESGLEQIEIKVEKHGEMLYAFRNDNDQFIGQGTSRDDLIKAMSERLRNVRCTVVEGSEYMKPEEA